MTNPLYPGDGASPEQLLQLAHEYRKAAHTLEQQGRPKAPLSRAPYRLSAIHAIELYLSALLIHSGVGQDRLRSFEHSLEERRKEAVKVGLTLSKGTRKHLEDLTQNREYLVARYGPELMNDVSEITRLNKSLKEVGAKVSNFFSAGV